MYLYCVIQRQLLYVVKSYIQRAQYFSHTEVLIIKVYRKKVLLIPPNLSYMCAWIVYMQLNIVYPACHIIELLYPFTVI